MNKAHTTHINHVEIKVEGDPDPARIARRIAQVLDTLKFTENKVWFDLFGFSIQTVRVGNQPRFLLITVPWSLAAFER